MTIALIAILALSLLGRALCIAHNRRRIRWENRMMWARTRRSLTLFRNKEH